MNESMYFPIFDSVTLAEGRIIFFVLSYMIESNNTCEHVTKVN